MSEGQRRAKRVLLFSEMPEDADPEAARRPTGARRGKRRLIDHSHLAPKPGRNLPLTLILEGDEQRGERERRASRGIGGKVAIEIRSGEYDDERSAWKARSKTGDGVMALPRVQRDHQVTACAVPPRCGSHDVAGAAQEPGVALRRVPIASPRACRRRRDDRDFHSRAFLARLSRKCPLEPPLNSFHQGSWTQVKCRLTCGQREIASLR